ncbi:SAM-dependent methyltransferase [Stieleria varia]|uniref:Ribosomal protein L11 methyltransferase n=1 Tax=Stieleria varia TaxID=2528005 RepID=A0A5C6B0U4_9BACT|nr:methyltransferase domain-containing protein [Stieleria varia]TWU05079.1 Ribosomal protein L11 methyltransferase [Stieleria varia]
MLRFHFAAIAWSVTIVGLFTTVAHSTADDRSVEPVESAITVPTPDDVVAKMLDLVKVKKDDVLYDLGCGDGRIVVAAAVKYRCRAVGFDINPLKIDQSRERVKQAGVQSLVRIEQKDIFKVDLAPATVLTLYLLPEMNDQLVPQIQKMKAGTRIVCHDFPIEAFQPEQRITIKSVETDAPHEIFLYRLPLKPRK